MHTPLHTNVLLNKDIIRTLVCQWCVQKTEQSFLFVYSFISDLSHIPEGYAWNTVKWQYNSR